MPCPTSMAYTRAAPRCSSTSVKPPVEAPRSAHTRLAGATPKRSSAASSFSPPPLTARGPLGLAERGVGHAQDAGASIAMLGEAGHADRDGNAGRRAAAHVVAHGAHGLANQFGPRQGGGQRGVRQNHNEFFAAIAADNVFGARIRPQQVADSAQDLVPGLMPQRVIE